MNRKCERSGRSGIKDAADDTLETCAAHASHFSSLQTRFNRDCTVGCRSWLWHFFAVDDGNESFDRPVISAVEARFDMGRLEKMLRFQDNPSLGSVVVIVTPTGLIGPLCRSAARAFPIRRTRPPPGECDTVELLGKKTHMRRQSHPRRCDTMRYSRPRMPGYARPVCASAQLFVLSL